MPKLKDTQVVLIGEDGEPLKNEDGTFKTENLYRGFTDKESYSNTIQEKTGNVLKKKSEVEKELETFKSQEKEKSISSIYSKLGVDDNFTEFIDLKIDKSRSLEEIENDVKSLIETKPVLKKRDASGGIPTKKDDETVKKVEEPKEGIRPGIHPRDFIKRGK